MSKVFKWAAGTAVIVAAAFGGWSLMKPEPQSSFITEVVKRGDIRQTVSATGEISPSNLVSVGAEASGQIKKLYVKLGQQVKKGDLIAEIDSTNQINTLNTEKSKLETYQAKLVSAEIALSSAEKKAESELGHTRITATMDGTVVAIPVEEGQSVNAAQSTPTIIQLANLETMLNKMQIAEGDITKVKAGQDISFTILSEPDTPIKAKLDSVDPGLTTMSLGNYTSSTDTTSNAIYYYARALVPNNDGKLSIGMTTQNTIEINGVKNVLLVPTLTVKKHNGKSYVSILGADNKAIEREVTVGLKDSMNTEIKSGLKEGEKVIISEMSADEKNKSSERAMMGGGPPR